MADVKISQLPAATTPVDGTEVLPIVQSATTKQVSIANLTSGRALSALSLTLTNPLAVTSGGTGLATTAAGTLLSSTALNTISATATPTLGVAGTTAGSLGLSGSSSGVVTLNTAAAAGTWSMTLPTSGGTNGYILTTNGSGVTSWTNPTALGVDLDVGTTAITGGTTGRVLYDNAGVLGEYTAVPVGFGGTGTSTQFTAGSVVFAGASGVYSQNNSNLFWDNSNNRLGIGTTSPQQSLVISNGGAQGIEISPNATASAPAIVAYNRSGAAYLKLSQFAANYDWYVGSSQVMTLDSSGNLLVGTTNNITSNTNTKFAVKSASATSSTRTANQNAIIGSNGSGADVSLQFTDSVTNNYYFGGYNGTAYVTTANNQGVKLSAGATTWASDSDERLKNIDGPILNAIAGLNSLRTVHGRYKTDDASVNRLFLIAQDVQKVYPQAVDVENGEEGILLLRYSDLIPPMIAAIQELAAEVATLKEQLNA